MASVASKGCLLLEIEMQSSTIDPERVADESAEMHHRFSNTLQMVGTLLSREARRNAGTACADALGKAEAQIVAFGLLHDQLRVGGQAAERDPCAAAYLGSVCRHLEDACLRPRDIDLVVRMREPLRCEASTCRTIGLIVTELVLNAAKHAFASRRGGRVIVSLERHVGMGGMRLVVSDDGEGMADGAIERSGGLAIVEFLSRSVRASCRCETGPEGTSFEFLMPSRQVSRS